MPAEIFVLKKYLLIFLPLIIGVSNAYAEISIQNDQHYVGDDGTFHIVGEIRNDFDAPLNQISVYASLFSNGEVIGEISSNSLVNTIMPGMIGPFDIMVVGEKSKKIDDYALDINYKITEPKKQVIEITSSKFNRDDFDNLIITGTVANQGDITANTISIVATLYDRDGNVAGVSKTLTEPDYLRAEDETFFLVTVPDKEQTANVVDYTLVAESEEYAAVPEFPLGSLLLLAASVSSYVVLTRYSSRFITNLVSASNLK